MELFAKIVDYIEPLTIFATHVILGVSQGYEKNPVAFSFISQKLGLESLQISSTFKFSFIFTLLPCAVTLLITNSIHLSFILNGFTHAAEYI